jgi:hypothetical protein
MMPNVSLVELIPSSTGSGSTAHDGGVDYLLPKELMAIIESLIVNEMTQQLYGWLGSFLLEFRHVDVVNEDSDGFIRSCSEQSLSLLVELRLYGELRLLGLGLC